MFTWKIACVQMDCKFADKVANLKAITNRLAEAAEAGARLVIFPECAITGYAFRSKEEAWPIADPIPGSSVQVLEDECRRLGVFAVVGSLEKIEKTGKMFNVAVLVGPSGIIDVYRKIHLPYLGVDRFTTPGDRPFAVHDLGGLRVGMNICYDGSFPESARCLSVLGADLVVLPTNWPTGALGTSKIVPPVRAHENHIYFAACNRVGEERGVQFVGRSQIVDVGGEVLALSGDAEEILYSEVDPQRARDKHQIKIAGEYELHRLAHRRPDMYQPLLDPVKEQFKPSK